MVPARVTVSVRVRYCGTTPDINTYEQKSASHGRRVCGGRGGRRSRVLSRGDVSGTVFDVTRRSARYLQGLNNEGIRGRTIQREVLAVALA